ncbi:MAG: anaerobic ribonucleoside-triphosphate reductase activating protein [Candidatus Methanoperedens sp.]|nr:anaerobic ribonucleoside-triphosphate reductase activating protein [Candidatus Methanoperedens sp.]
MKLIFSGIVIPISTIDWYGRSVSVIFFNGCNFKCLYCSNNNFIKVANQRIEPLYKGGNVMEIQEIEKMILDAKSFISAVVFSGGEPTTQYDSLEHLARFSKKHGLLVGIETNGYYPERLSKLIELKLLDKIFLDVKAPLDDAQKYSKITGGKDDAAERVRKSLELENVDIEVRTTVFKAYSDVLGIAKDLEGKNCTYVIQQGLPENAPEGEIRKDSAFTREEMIALARSIDFLKDIRIRTKEKGEEIIIAPIPSQSILSNKLSRTR